MPFQKNETQYDYLQKGYKKPSDLLVAHRMHCHLNVLSVTKSIVLYTFNVDSQGECGIPMTDISYNLSELTWQSCRFSLRNLKNLISKTVYNRDASLPRASSTRTKTTCALVITIKIRCHQSEEKDPAGLHVALSLVTWGAAGNNLLFLWHHCRNFLQEDLLQGKCHQHNVVCGLTYKKKLRERSSTPEWGVKHMLAAPHLVVYVAVGEHSVEVLQTLCGAPVVVVVQPLLDGAQVHRWCYNVIVILIQTDIHHFILKQPVLLSFAPFKFSSESSELSFSHKLVELNWIIPP